MKETLLLFAIGFCQPPTIVNNTNTWNKMDQKTYHSAQKRCVIHYPNSPCLKRFIKVEFNTYRALCGKSK